MIHVEGLTKYYNHFCAVDNMNLTIHKGEILGLLGPNGAGKTTTLRMLTGYFRPTSGTINIKGLSIEDNLLDIKKSIGYLPESAPLYNEMLVYDYLDYVAGIRELSGDRKLTRLKQLADMCGLNDIMHKAIGELSKGLKQRVGLAHALMGDPEILILDEPTSGLDPNQIVEIRKIIREIGKQKTIIFSTHILSEAEATCDRIVIVNRGKIVADGTPDQIKESTGVENTITAVLKNADFSDVKRCIAGIEEISDVEKVRDLPDGSLMIRIHCRANSDPREKVYGIIKQQEWVLLGFQQELRTLETIFRNLTMEN